MTTPVWQAGRLYPPGSLVQPSTRPAPVFSEIPNGTFEDGNTGWTLDSAFTITNAGDAFTGSWSLQFAGSASGYHVAQSTYDQPVMPGDTLTVRMQVQQGASGKGQVGANVNVYWLDAAHAFISAASGNVVNDGSGGAWHASSVTATVPAGAAFARAVVAVNRVGDNDPLWVDNVEWDYVSRQPPPGLVFRATQPTAGYSGPTEPTWPTTTGVQVNDNEVVWEGVFTSRVTWRATPVLLSGATEPAWAAQVGASVADGTIIWKAVSLRIEDPKCPNSKIVAKGAGKIYAGDDDIVRYNATGNPRDWSSADDAGFLPVGMNQGRGSNPVSLLNLYRKHLAVMTADQFQPWQIDPDPSLNELLDTKEGIGSTYHLAAQPVGDELFYLSNLGVRTIGLSASANNMAAGDIGMPVDPLVVEAMKVADANEEPPLGAYLPSMGQYWLAFTNYPPGPLVAGGDLGDGQIGDVVDFQYSASGGVKPFSWSVLNGTLPDGLSLSSSGRLTGTRESTGARGWTVRVVDGLGNHVDVPDSSLTYGWNSAMSAWTGTGAATVSPPIATKLGNGGMVWSKSQSADGDHLIDYSLDGATVRRLIANDTAGSTLSSTTFDDMGATFTGQNVAGVEYAAAGFARAPGVMAIVEYTGTGAAHSIAHDLGAVPGMMIVKAVDFPSNFIIYHQGWGATHSEQGWTGAIGADASAWNNTAPTDAQFSVGTSNVSNRAGTNYVAFLFADSDDVMVDVVANATTETAATFPRAPGWLLGVCSGGSALADAFYNDMWQARWQFTRPNSPGLRSWDTGSRSRLFGPNPSAGFEFGQVGGGAPWIGLTGFLAIPERRPARNEAAWAPGEAFLAGAQIMALSNGNRTCTVASGVNNGMRSSKYRNAGKHYFEVAVGGTSASNFEIGLATIFDGLGAGNSSRWAYYVDGRKASDAGYQAYSGAYGLGDVIGVAVDIDAKKVWFSKNGVFVGDPVAGTGEAFATLKGVSLYAYALMASANGNATLNAAAADMVYSPPSGFLPWVIE